MAHEGLPGEYVPVSNLTPVEVGFFHPKNWEGETIGYRVKRERLSGFSPIHSSLRNTPALLRGISIAHEARKRAYFDSKRYIPRAVYRPGEEFKAADHKGGVILFDQSTLITRGPQFHLKPEEFPEQPPFVHPELGVAPVHVKSERFHYVREIAGTAMVGKGNEAQLVRVGSMDNFTGFAEYPYPAGNIALPELITVGEPQHFMTNDSKQILYNTHAVHVYPKP